MPILNPKPDYTTQPLDLLSIDRANSWIVSVEMKCGIKYLISCMVKSNSQVKDIVPIKMWITR